MEKGHVGWILLRPEPSTCWPASRSQGTAQTMDSTEVCSSEQSSPRLVFCQDPENMARGLHWSPHPHDRQHPHCLACCWMGALTGQTSQTRNTGAGPVTWRRGGGYNPPRRRRHPLSPQILTHCVTYPQALFPICSLQSKHAILLLLLGRGDRRPCHHFYTANCC